MLLKVGSSIFEKFAVVSEEENEWIKPVGSQVGLSLGNTQGQTKRCISEFYLIFIIFFVKLQLQLS